MEMTSIRPHVTKYGLILGLVAALFTIIFYISGLYLSQQWIGNLSFIFTLAFMVIACREYKTENGGILPFGKAFLVAFFVGLIGIVLNSIINYIYISLVDPGIMQNMMDKQLAELAENPSISDEQLEATEEMMANFQNPLFIVGSSLFGGAFISALLGLIVAAIVKKNPES